MKLNLRKTDTYIPEWNENRNLPENEQIEVEFEYLTTADKEELFIDKNDKSVGSIAKQCWLKKVKKIHRLDIMVDGELTSATAENILNLPDMFELFTEVASHIFTASSLNREQSKN